MDTYIRELKLAAPLDSIKKFRRDIRRKLVPGDADDIRLAAYQV